MSIYTHDLFKSNTTGSVVEVQSVANYVIAGELIYFQYVGLSDKIEELPVKEFEAQFTRETLKPSQWGKA